MWVLVEWKREVFILGYRSNGTWKSSALVTVRMEQEILRDRVPVELNREIFIVGTGGIERENFSL